MAVFISCIKIYSITGGKSRGKNRRSEGQRDRGTEGQKDRRTEGQKDRRTEGQKVGRSEGATSIRRKFEDFAVLPSLCPSVHPSLTFYSLTGGIK